MTEHEETGRDDTGPDETLEFVAVTPREVVPAAPGTEPEPASAAESELQPPAEAAAVEAEAPEADAPSAAEPEPTETQTATQAETQTGTQPQPPAVPPLEPAPESVPADDREVSVRVAAEGMAAALAGQPGPVEAPAPPADRALGPVAVATAVCVVLAVAAGALLGVTARSDSHRRAVAAARVAALTAAKKDAALLLTYSYQTFDQDIARAEAAMSSKFRANYASTVNTEVRPLALKNHSTTKATVAAAGVVSATPDSVQVLVYADQVVTNTLLSAVSRLDRSVIEVSMVKRGGRWLLDDVHTY